MAYRGPVRESSSARSAEKWLPFWADLVGASSVSKGRKEDISTADVWSQLDREAKDVAIGAVSSVCVIGTSAWVRKGLTACQVSNRADADFNAGHGPNQPPPSVQKAESGA